MAAGTAVRMTGTPGGKGQTTCDSADDQYKLRTVNYKWQKVTENRGWKFCLPGSISPHFSLHEYHLMRREWINNRWWTVEDAKMFDGVSHGDQDSTAWQTRRNCILISQYLGNSQENFVVLRLKAWKKKRKRASFIIFSQSGWVMASVLQRPSSIAAIDQRRDGNSAILRESARTEERSLF